MRTDTPHVLITGGTGILGSWLVAGAVRRGYRPVVLLRDATEAAAQQRLRAVLDVAGDSNMADQVEVVLGDVQRPRFGLSIRESEALRARLAGVVHSAASTSFSPRKDALLRATNVEAVRGLVEWLTGSGVPLYHVSTAYTAGASPGTVHESDLPHQVPVKNTYEATKREAEDLIQQSCAAGRLRASIFRPSIIVGARSDGRISQFLNFYTILRFVDLLARGAAPRVRLQGNPGSTLNLVPVDWVAEAMWQIIEREGATGDTYHLTHPQPPTQAEVTVWAARRLKGHAHFAFVPHLEGAIEPAELYANHVMQRYRNYLADEPHFDQRNTLRGLGGAMPLARLDNIYFDALLDYALSRDWHGAFAGDMRRLSFDATLAQAADPTPLRRPLTLDEPLRAVV